MSRFRTLGQNRDEIRPGLRSFMFSPCVVCYRPVEETIEILRILHGARDVGPIIAAED